MSVLDQVNSPADVKKLSNEALEELASDVRRAVLNKVSQVGGHVGPNLGVTELTIALHRVFHSPIDKFIWDVSHQTYPHKILTGRKEGFVTGHFHEITPYTSQEESEHDFFTVGHTSTSVANALGFAKARDLTHQSGNVIAILGDGSFSGGLALEALNNAGQFDGNLIIIMNDNDMSIAENHGGLYPHLASLRQSNGTAKNNIFKAFGLDYRYLESGNDIQALIALFEEVKDCDHPIVLHIHTVKGLGYEPALKNKENWHWHVPFDLETGVSLSPSSNKESYSSILMDYMDQKMQEGQPILAINAAIPAAYNLKDFAHKYPDHYWDAGIAEQFTITFGGAAALNGAKSFIFHNSTFVQRAFDQFVHDLAINHEPAIVFIKGDVISSSDQTHQGDFARGWLSNIPNLIYLAPTSKEELLNILDWAMTQDENPVVINIPEHGVEHRLSALTDFKKPAYQLEKQGQNVAILGLGGMFSQAEKVVLELQKSGIEATLVNPIFVSSLDCDFLSALTTHHQVLATFEDGVLDGGFGQKVASFLGQSPIKVLNFGADKEFNEEVPVSELYQRYHLTPELAAKDILSALQN